MSNGPDHAARPSAGRGGLKRMSGDAGVRNLLAGAGNGARTRVSRRVRVAPADDPAEAAADRAADAALERGSIDPVGIASGDTPTRIARRSGPGDGGPVVGREGGDLDDGTSAAIDRARTGGAPLDAGLRGSLETGFGTELGGVRVHTDATADQLSRSIQAEAFTVGNDVFFSGGAYRPDSGDGQHLIAHEVAHVVQQGAGGVREGGSGGVQRRIATTSKTLTSTMSTGKVVSAAITNSTLNQLIKALDTYHKNKDVKHDLWYVDIVLALSRKYLDTHVDDVEGTAGTRRRLVEDLEAQAFAEQGKLKAADSYLEGMKDASIKHQANPGFTQPAAESVAKGEATNAPGANQESVDLAKEYGLTEAEILAVKTYSASDYKYINPATANADGWMKGMFSKASDGELKSRKLEGAMQAGMLMSAFGKMPAMKGTVYRGTRLSPTEFDDQYVKQSSIKFNAFSSSALQPKVARGFANGGGQPRPDQTVSVFLEVEVTNARDLRQLSIFGYTEAEWLLLPGATFSISKVEDDPQHDAGAPAATLWKKVTLTQTA